MADENWALTMRELQSGSGRGAFLLGTGIAMWVFWVTSTIIGAAAGGVIGDPASYGIDFVLAAVFVALATELWEGRSTLVPWLVALATAIVAAALVPGQWYILLGGFAAAAVEVIRMMGEGALALDPLVVGVVLAMALVTALTKVGGLWLLRRIEVSERLEAGLSVLPGAIVIAILGPELAAGGPAEWGAAGIVLLVMWRTESILLSLCSGVGTVVLFRAIA